MLLGVPLTELLWLALAVIVAGIVTGVLAGLFGIGGGAVIVPTTILSYLAHREKDLVIPQVIRVWAAPAVLGVICGAVIAAFAPAAVFKIAFVVIATLIAVKFFFAGDRWNLGTDLPGTAAMSVYGFGIGLCGSLMGVSGGSLSNIVLTLYGKPIHNAVATSAGLGVPITIVGTLGYIAAGLPHEVLLPPLSLGFVSLIGLAVIAPLSSLTAPYGARLAHRLSRRTLEITFATYLLLVSLRFLVSLY